MGYIMSTETTGKIHTARLNEFERRKKLGLFSKDFQEDAEKFVDHQLKRIGDSQSRIPGIAMMRNKRRKRQWNKSLGNLPDQCGKLSREECMGRRDCFLSGYTNDNRGGLETNLDLVNEDGNYDEFICKNIHKLEPVSALSNAEMGKKRKLNLLRAKRLAESNNPRSILRFKMNDGVEKKRIEARRGGKKETKKRNKRNISKHKTN